MKGKRDKAFRAVLRRYHALVDRKFLHGLTPRESRKMESLGRRLDKHDAAFYAPILARLKATVYGPSPLAAALPHILALDEIEKWNHREGAGEAVD